MRCPAAGRPALSPRPFALGLALAVGCSVGSGPLVAQRSPVPAPAEAGPRVAPRGPLVGTITTVLRDEPDAARLAEPNLVPPNGADPYVLDLRGYPLRPEPGLDARLLERVRAEPNGASFAMAMLAGAVLQERVDELTVRGAEFLGVHPWQCVKLRVPHAAVPALMRLDSVRWLGLPEPGQKLDPALAAAIGEGATTLHVHVNLFASELGPDSQRVPIDVPVRPASLGARGETLPVMRWRTRGPVLAQLTALGFEEESWDEHTRSYRGTLPASALDALLELDAVLFVEPVLLPTPNHAQSVAMINQDRVRGTYDGQGVAVGVIDGGISGNPWHQDYAGKWYWWWDNTGFGATNDHDGHGTHVTGTIVGEGVSDQRLMGMAPGVGRDANARVFVGRFFDDDDNPWGDPGWLYSAFLAPPNGRRPAVVNNSWGADALSSPWNGTEVQARQIDGFVHASDQTYCFSAGNNASNSTSISVGSPASAKNVLTVGSVDVAIDANRRAGSRSGFSDFGTGDQRVKPDLMAPGSVITSCLADSLDRYTQKSGTSMAAPHVSGVIASLADNNAWFEYNPPAVKALLLATATNGNLGNRVGHGLVDSHRANFGWNWVYGGTLAAPFTWSYFDIDVPANMSTMKVVTTWVEPPVSAGSSNARVNNLTTYLDIEPFSGSGTDGWPISSATDTVTSLYGSSAVFGVVRDCLGKRVRVKVYANSIFPGTNAKWSVCVALGFADGTRPMQFTLTPSTTMLRPDTNFTVSAALGTGAGNVALESARIALTGYGAATLSSMQRTTADGVVHAFGGTGYWSFPYPTVGDMVVGSGVSRDLLFALRSPSSSAVLSITGIATAQGRDQVFDTATVCVDGLAPQTVAGLTSPSHPINAWSRNPDLRIDWSAAVDNGCSGIEGLAWSFGADPNVIPTQRNLSGDPRTLSFPGLASSSTPYHFAIRAVDRVGNLSTTTARLGGFLIDTLAPSLLAVTINGGAAYTGSTRVDLSFSASDAPSGVSIISYSLDGTTWSSFDPYTGFAANFDLGNPAIGGNANEGTKTVHVRVADRAGNLSAVRTASIQYLRVPSISGLSSNPFPTVTTDVVVVSGLDFREASAVMLGTRTITSHRLEDLVDGLFLVANDGTIYFHPPQGLSPGAYALRVLNAAGTSAPMTLNLVAPTSPALSTSSFPRAGGPQTFVIHRGNLPATTIAYLALSPSNTPSAIPGLIQLGIGNAFASLSILEPAFPTAAGTGLARIGPVTIPASFGGTVLWYQAILIDLANPAATPIPVTNAVRCQYLP